MADLSLSGTRVGGVSSPADASTLKETVVRAVVTGVAGFIGSHLAERLIAEGWSVTGVDAFTPYYDAADKEANLAGLADEPRFDLVRADVVSFPLRDLLSDRPAVVHLAAQPGVRGSFGHGFEDYVHDNVLATQRVFESAQEAGWNLRKASWRRRACDCGACGRWNDGSRTRGRTLARSLVWDEPRGLDQRDRRDPAGSCNGLLSRRPLGGACNPPLGSELDAPGVS